MGQIAILSQQSENIQPMVVEIILNIQTVLDNGELLSPELPTVTNLKFLGVANVTVTDPNRAESKFFFLERISVFCKKQAL